MMRKIFTCLFIFILLLLFITGCERFKGDQEIPAYIQIDTIALTVSSTAFPGITPTANIVDAWITVDGWHLGAYQMPARIPVLKRGEQKVVIQPGILANNLSLRRGPYPFYTRAEVTVNLAEDSVTVLKDVKVTLNDLANIAVNETFEDASVSFDTLSISNTTIKRVRNSELDVPVPTALYGAWVGNIQLTLQDSTCWLVSKDAFSLPFNQAVYVEVDYCCDNKFTVGFECKNRSGQIEYYHIVEAGVKGTKEWNKLYANISTRVTEQVSLGATDFKIFILANIEEGKRSASLYFDNIRLIYPKTE